MLETSREAGFPTPGLGRVRDVVVNRLPFPTAIRFGPDAEPGEILGVNVGGAPPYLASQ